MCVFFFFCFSPFSFAFVEAAAPAKKKAKVREESAELPSRSAEQQRDFVWALLSALSARAPPPAAAFCGALLAPSWSARVVAAAGSALWQQASRADGPSRRSCHVLVSVDEHDEHDEHDDDDDVMMNDDE